MDLTELPDNLPIPVDDGAADHLLGMELPDIPLPSTSNSNVYLKQTKLTVIYIYPMIGNPNQALPNGWNDIPGARGCTPESCAYRDHHSDLKQYGATVYGLSVQDLDYQIDARKRLGLPFHLISDERFLLKEILKIPTFELSDKEYYKRTTLITDEGYIRKVFYPVFPPQENAEQVLKYLESI